MQRFERKVVIVWASGRQPRSTRGLENVLLLMHDTVSFSFHGRISLGRVVKWRGGGGVIVCQHVRLAWC